MKKRGLKIVLLGVILLAAISGAVMLLWNWLIPGIFGLACINFWQALGLFVLARLLFGRLGFGHGRRMMHGKMGENPIHEKWKNMTPEERIAFIQKRKRFGFGGPFGKNAFGMDENEGQEKNDE